MPYGANLIAIECYDSDGLTIECNKLDFVRPTIGVNVHHRADISSRELFARQVGDEHYAVVFAQRIHNGCAVMSLGPFVSGVAIQTVRIVGLRPSGARNGPSTV